jgi:[acyl-carrier-protein] S-malonyltransferase
MSKVAFIFPGQGSQATGMGQQLAASHPEAAQAFFEADQALGFPLSRLCFEGPDDELNLTANTQPAILTASIAVYRVLSARVLNGSGYRPDFVAGHSLGEYSALVAAGSLSLAEAVRLVRRRGEAMQEAVPVGEGAMAAIIGLPGDEVTSICAAASGSEVCAPANFNSPTQVVIAGSRGAVERAGEECRSRKARVIMLKVSAPFHSALMAPAQVAMADPLARANFQPLTFPIINNIDAAIVTSGEITRDALLRQISGPVRWTESVRRMLDEGVRTFVEVGPGRVLMGLVKAIAKDYGVEVTLVHGEDLEAVDAALENANN